ncbi:hypothetical protein Bca4012_077348 [Brassica carinata]
MLQPPSTIQTRHHLLSSSTLATICCPRHRRHSLSAIINSTILNTEREERGDLSGGKMCVGMEGSGEDERLGGGCGSDELRGGVRRQVSETWSSSP